MKKSGRYNTKQRDQIMAYLQKNKDDHITVEQLIEDFKEEGCAIGTSTVYRYLDLLVKEGVLRKYMIEEGCPACFQYSEPAKECKEHFHLKCSVCGELYHVESENLTKAEVELSEKYGFHIDSLKTVFYGYCKKCKNEENQ